MWPFQDTIAVTDYFHLVCGHCVLVVPRRTQFVCQTSSGNFQSWLGVGFVFLFLADSPELAEIRIFSVLAEMLASVVSGSYLTEHYVLY